MTPLHSPPVGAEPVIYLKPGELADRLGVSRETIRRMARSGRIPCLRVGKSVRFSLGDVLERLQCEQEKARAV